MRSDARLEALEAERRAADIRRGIVSAAQRVITLHPTWDDSQVSRALGLRRDELFLVADARQAMRQR